MRLAFAMLWFTGILGASSPLVRLFTTSDGLARNSINRIRLDRDGLLWFCTVEGISIFDGARFTNLGARDGLPGRNVFDVLQAHDGVRWVATSTGLSRLDPKPARGQPVFTEITLTPQPYGGVEFLFEDASGTIWLGTLNGLYRFDPKKAQARAEIVPLGVERDVKVWAVVEDQRRRLWIGSSKGIYIFAPDNTLRHLGREEGVGDVQALLLDSSGRLWAGGDQLFWFDPTTQVPGPNLAVAADGHASLRIMSLHEDPWRRLWVGGFGLYRLLPEAPPGHRLVGATRNIPHGELGMGVIASDPRGNLWASLSNLGALRISAEPFEEISERDGLNTMHITSVFEDRRGELHVLTDSPRILHDWRNGRMLPRALRTPTKRPIDWGWGWGEAALQDHEGGWWLISGEGLLRYPPSDDSRSLGFNTPRLYTVADGLSSNIVLRVFEDLHGDIWAGTALGVCRWDRNTGTWRAYQLNHKAGAESGRMPVHAIAQDRQGAIWVGFAAPRLMRIRGGSAEMIPAGIEQGFINALLADRAGRLWIGTSTRGVGLVRDTAAPRVDFIAPAGGLPSDQVFSLAEDAEGGVYVAGGRGMTRILPSPDASTFRFSGIVVPGENHILYGDRRGGFWIGTLAALTHYTPRPETPQTPDAPRWRRVEAQGSVLPLSLLGEQELRGIEFSPRQDNISIEFRAPYYSASDRLRYQYRLRGADDAWSAPTESDLVHYANLHPGSYRFEARSVAEGGTSSAAVLEFRIAPPFWATIWFRLAAAAAAVAGALSLHRYRIRQAVLLERVRMRLANDLHDDLGAGLTEIAILSEVAKQKTGGAEVLQQVGQRARGLRASLSDVVWAIDPRFDSLADLAGRMRETAFRMLESGACSVEFSAPPEEQLSRIGVPPELRRHLLLFFKEAVTNVARHAGASSVRCEVSLSRDAIRVRVTDNGRGFDPAASYRGYGLKSLRERACEAGGEITIRSAETQGVFVELVAPLKKTT